MKTCSKCRYVTSTYPLDPIGTLYCDFIEDYVPEDKCCDEFKEAPLNGNNPGNKQFVCEYCGIYYANKARCNKCEEIFLEEKIEVHVVEGTC